MSYKTRPRHPVTGKRIRIRARSEGELASYVHRLENLRQELRLGIRTPEQVSDALRHLQRGRFTVKDAVELYMRRPIAKATRDNLRSLLELHLGELAADPFASLDGPAMQEWIEGLRRKVEDPTVANYWRRMSAVARFACEKGLIASAPWGSYRPRLSAAAVREPREAARSFEELARLIAAAFDVDEERRDHPVRLEAVIAVAALFGLRQGELGGLRWPDWTDEPPSLLIARQWDDQPLKRGTPPHRLAGVAELGAILDRQRQRLGSLSLYDPKGPIFPSKARSSAGHARAYLRGCVLTTLDLRAVVERAKLANVDAWSPHSLRDTFVTLEAAALGGDLRAVAERSRHASLTSLARYLRALSRNPAPPAFRLPAPSGGAGLPLLGTDATRPPNEEPPESVGGDGGDSSRTD